MRSLFRKSFRPAALSLLVPALALLFFIGCGGKSNVDGTITVFAAASLTDAFQEIADEFESNYSGVEVRLNFAGSQRLRSQLELGATADLFASADEQQMQLVQDAGLISDDIQYFASTAMSVIVSEQSGISDLSQLGEQGTRIVLAHENVPAGAYSRQLLGQLSEGEASLGEDYAELIMANVVSEEPSVKFVEQKVVLGEADAGIVYRPGLLSAQSSGGVRELPLPPEANAVRALYPIATLSDSGSRAMASRFISFLTSEDGRAILASYGFDAP